MQEAKKRCRKRRFVRLGAQKEGMIGPLAAVNVTGLADVLGSHWAGLGLARLSLRYPPPTLRRSKIKNGTFKHRKRSCKPQLISNSVLCSAFFAGFVGAPHSHTIGFVAACPVISAQKDVSSCRKRYIWSPPHPATQ
jgi:hypothetical protein